MFHLELLGIPFLLDDDGSPLAGRAVHRHRIALLALLSRAPSRRLSRDKLIAYLWPESGAERGRNLLKVSTYVLRKALGEGALLSAGDDLRLDTSVVRPDVVEFEAALQQADYARAVALYRGPFLDGFFLSDSPEFEQWADREREFLSTGYARAAEALAEAAESEADFSKAADWWKARAAHDPYDSRVALRLMQALVASGNRAGAFQHADLHQRLLQEEFGMDSSPEVAAFTDKLRTELASSPRATSAIVETESEPAARAEAEQNLASPKETPPHDPTQPPTPAVIEPGVARRRRWLAVSAVVGIACLAVVTWAVWALDPEPDRSIVVLPFVSLSTDQDDEYFSDGLTEEVITRLSAIPELKVISRTSAMYYKGRTLPVGQIADELSVAHVLEGSVRRSGGRVRITVQLISARADDHLWAENFEYELRDLFRVQEEIAWEVAQALRLNLGERERMLLSRQGTHDAEAFELYNRGRYVWNSRTKEGHEQAIEYFRRAIDRDPSYSDAYAGLADAYLTAFQLGVFHIPEAEAYSRIRRAAERALELDDQSATAHRSFALALWWQRDWPGTERELRRAIELEPGNATARSWYSLLLGGWGRLDEALRESSRAYELDPLSVVVSSNLAWTCYVARDLDCAIEQYRKTLDFEPSWANAYRGLGLVYAQLGRLDEAIQAVQRAIALRPDRTDYLADLAYMLALAGRRTEAFEMLDKAKQQPWEPLSVVRAHVALDEPDSAFAWFERSNWRWSHRANIFDPTLDPLRKDPRFAPWEARIMRQMGVQGV